jgi:hypothetical protein
MICGIPFMEVRDLVDAVLSGDLLSARQWVADAQREGVTWESVPYPCDLAGRELTVAAGLIELLAERAGKTPPAWTSSVGAERLPLVLDPGLEDMPRSFARAQTAGPEPLRKRNLFALPDFLHVA